MKYKKNSLKTNQTTKKTKNFFSQFFYNVKNILFHVANKWRSEGADWYNSYQNFNTLMPLCPAGLQMSKATTK